MARIQTFHPTEPDAVELERSGYTNGQRIPMSEVLPAVRKIFRETCLNIMIQRYGTEDCTIWVDKGHFRQK